MPLKFGNRDILNIAQAVERNKEDIEALKNRPLLEIKFVDELPETGEAGILYLVPVEDGEDPNNYEEYIWADGEWELIGSTAVDISNMCTTDTAQEISGAKTFTSDVTLYAETGDSPALTFLRGEAGDAYNDWTILDKNGYLQFNQDSTVKFYMKGNSLVPGANSSIDLGEDGGYFKEAKVNKYTVATSGYDISKDGSSLKLQADGNPIIFRGNVEPTVDGTYALGKSNVRWSVVNSSKLANDYSNLTLKGNPGITLQMSANSSITPSNDASYTIGTSTARFKSLNLSHYVDWNNNVFIGKDSSNRFYVSGSDGNIKLKIGASETLVATKLSPDVSNSYDIGRTGLRWNYGYINYLVASDDTVIPTTDIAMKSTSQATEVWAQGTLDSSTAEDTIDISAQGVGMPDAGIYMFTYGNAQTMLYLDSTMIQNAALYPIRVTCPVLQEAGGNISGATGNLKISRSSDVLTIKVASTISGNATSTNGWGWKLFKTGL